MTNKLTRWTLPLLSVALIGLLALSAQGQNYWSASGTTFSDKGTNFAIAVPDASGRCAVVETVTLTSTDTDDWLEFYKTTTEALVTLTNLPAGGGTNLVVTTTNGFAKGDLLLFNSRTGNVWSVCVVGAANLTSTNIMVVTNAIGHTAFSTAVPRYGDRVYKLTKAARINLAAPINAGGLWTYPGLTNLVGGWSKLTLPAPGPYFVGDPGKPVVISLRDNSPGSAIVVESCTNEIWSVGGSYK